uniref:Uncharacterized protein n=1 Tax=Craspedostauros australis TaxID=1486917 RepID=A0A7R9ZPA8_9STRA|mmetsp:Transcript_22027/g.61292  ORF Transcript_22027/g.61292 Transcript_22027/m.61292 type:complete len:116 (+) Transcript_22027:237-584(+)
MSLMLLRSLWRQWRQSGLPWNIFIECLHGIHPRTHDIATDVAPAAVDADVDAADAADGVTVTAANDENIKSHRMPTSTTPSVAHPSSVAQNFLMIAWISCGMLHSFRTVVPHVVP